MQPTDLATSEKNNSAVSHSPASRTSNAFPVPQYVPVWARIHIPTHNST